jgi:hypothetical protein
MKDGGKGLQGVGRGGGGAEEGRRANNGAHMDCKGVAVWDELAWRESVTVRWV